MRTYRQVTEFEPKVAAMLARHADRLIAPTPPRGLWVCEEDGEPLIVLTVYTEPRIRISAILDRPDEKPAASLTRLAAEFEAWALEVGIASYCVVIHRGDDEYAKIIERRGGVVLSQDDEWTEYLHEIDQTPDTSDALRPWRPSDWKALRHAVRAALQDRGALGVNFLPTRRTVEAVIRTGMRGAGGGDPCLLAYGDGKINGFIIGVGHTGPFEMRARVCSIAGLYCAPTAAPDLRHQLVAAAIEKATGAGYTRIDSMVYTPGELDTWKARGANVPGVVVQLPLVKENT